MKKIIRILAAFISVLYFASCQDYTLEWGRQDNPDGSVNYAPVIANGNDMATKAYAIEEVRQMLTSEDGSFTLPIICEQIAGINTGASADEPATKATLINESGAVKPLGDFATSIDNTFWVTAWNDAEKPSQIIPDATAKAFTGGYVAGSAEIGFYQKVMYRTKNVANETLSKPYWMTMQPMPELNAGVTAAGPADDEYIWKSSEATKTFFAYANLPGSGITVANTAVTEQTLTLSTLPDKDILLGYYSGNGYSGSPATMTGTASIRFYHPLTAVKFKKGLMPEGVSITSISINGIYTSGKTIQDSSTGTAFVWTKTDGIAYTADDETGSVSPSNYTVDGQNFIGSAILLIPETFANAKSRIVVNLNTPSGSKTLYYPLKGITWSAGCTNIYTIGYDEYTFTFELTDPSQSAQAFYNSSTDSSPATINITSKKKDLTGETPEGWRILSYKIGSENPVTVGGDSFNDGGLTVSKEGSSLKITAHTRTASIVGNHEYWTNEGGVSGDTEGTGWSPKDWSTTVATTSSPLDLSKFNFKTETSQAMTTANCYVVRHAGTYKIPLVYGNGIVGGNENTRSYNPTLSGNTQPLSPLVDYLNQGITSAFIENKAECVPTGCAVLWQDEAVVIKDLVITGATASVYDASNVRYLQFTVDPSTICQNNALICIYKDKNGNSKYDSGEAIWSWHIWTTNNPALIGDAIPVTNHSGRVYNFFPIYNIGYVDGLIYYGREQVIITLEQSESGKTTTITVNQPLMPGPSHGNYYQFGRKDPMCGKNTPASGSFYILDASLTDIYVNHAITTPDTFYNCTTYVTVVGWKTWAWPYSNLWSGKATYEISYENDSEIFKTIYDPSPVGYKVPASKAYTGFTTTGAGTAVPSEYNVSYFSNGYFFYTDSSKSDVIYFPASGYRHSETGVITDLGGRGSYWSAVSGNESSGWQLLFFNGNSSGLVPDNLERRANGQSVRPVLE